MSHQPFESLLFAEQPLSAEQQNSLEAHLKECNHCSELADALMHLEETFAASIAPPPAPGFSQRWLSRLSAKRLERQTRNLWLMTIGLFSCATLILLVIALLNINQLNWAYELSQFIARVSVVAAQMRQIVHIIQLITSTLPFIAPVLLIFGIGALFAVSALVVTWFSSIVNLYSPIKERGNLS